MFIRNCLTALRTLKLVLPSETVSDVLTKMEGHLSLPCVSLDGTFLGLVSKRTIFEAFQRFMGETESYETFLEQPISPCIDSSVTALQLDSKFEDTLPIIVRHPFVPIVESGKLIGIVKRSDVNNALNVAFGNNVKATRILLGMAEVEGSLHRLFTVTHRLGINVITAIPFDAGNPLNRRLILKVSPTEQLKPLIEQLEKAGFLIISVEP